MRIPGSTVLLTGATGGIGEAIARELHRRGAQQVLTGRRVEVLEPLAQELGARALAVDLADRAAVERLLAEAGAVDILVANAALPGAGRLEDFAQEEIDRTLEVNLRAPIAMARTLAPAMAARGGGHLLFVSSLSGKAATPLSSLYDATKFGLRGFALGLRPELRTQNVGVTVLNPGFIREAGMFATAGAKLPPGVGTRTPHDVAVAVADAIERNRTEVDVAPLALRVGTMFAGVAPALAATATRMSGGEQLAVEVAAGHRAAGRAS
ncbi:MAG TPA: SDR family NAD(P)-dependent oxidoreductase [Solirubrobacteraceae bacterium]|jgi:short-subunit dehydrogenase|nr:SDR family NAD(P)-dependent oxidoreductase [Solirubrobacteraceae bacterium]